ncbi:ATP-binding protein [Citromicrobium bathyomarinum]|uniref:ATP-binding protein n=1 Tax=Citromicrobium bathyomarinum TaxID=72174 RepID=UPI001E283A70|nr:ATP-binding protein [Citromicrobium bathyomarinum]MCD1623075.1 ATP-binding protein [Citromicrobium bathyomarinum]
MKYKLKEVFAAGGVPTVTYVDRAELELEKRIERALERGFTFNVVTGPTKSGKSVLCQKVLGDAKLIQIEGGQVENAEEFWSQLGHFLQIAATETTTDKASGKVSVSAKPGWFVDSLVKLTGGMELGAESSNTKQFVKSLKIAAIEALIRSDAVLLIDDFHYIPAATQKEIIQSFKKPVADGLKLFFLAVPHRGFDPINVEKEVEGRFKHIKIPTWDMTHLTKIATLGFPALNVKCDNSKIADIASQATRNPLLMQEICAELCLENGIKETQTKLITLDMSKLTQAYREVAESKGFPTFQLLQKGPQAKKLREQRLLADGTTEDIYSLIMKALAHSGPKPTTSYDELR